MSSLLAHPDPAASWVAFDVVLSAADAGTLLIRDASGREVAQLAAAGARTQVLWDVRAVANGVYSVELRAQGRTLAHERVVVNK